VIMLSRLPSHANCHSFQTASTCLFKCSTIFSYNRALFVSKIWTKLLLTYRNFIIFHPKNTQPLTSITPRRDQCLTLHRQVPNQQRSIHFTNHGHFLPKGVHLAYCTGSDHAATGMLLPDLNQVPVRVELFNAERLIKTSRSEPFNN
jgi:hypothetical protein